MITIFGVPWPAWWVIIAAAAVLVAVAGRAYLRPRTGYLWCDDCEVWCDESNDPCDCCCDELAEDLHNELELERIGEYDDGEPFTGELRAVDDDEQWTRELAELNRARRAGELDELERVPTPIFVALSDDPDLIAWDLRQQAARTWEIAHVGFPALRAQIARDYAAAAAESRDYWRQAIAA